MSVTIRWQQRAAGRNVGDTETVERTLFIDGVIAQGRVEVLSEDLPAELEPILAEAVASPRVIRDRRPASYPSIEAETPVTFSLPVSEPEAPAVEASSEAGAE